MAHNSWQEICTKALEAAVAAGRNGRQDWESFRAKNQDQNQRIIIADASFDEKSLRGFDLSRCYITRTSFRKADLSQADFSQAIFRSCDATEANIEGAKFRGSDQTADGLKINTRRYDASTDFEVYPNLLPDEIDAGLRLKAMRARREREWRYRRSRAWPVRFLLWLTDYGYSLKKLSAAAPIFIVIFSFVFYLLGKPYPDSLLASCGYFLGLNSADTGGYAQAIGFTEGLLGMLFFSILTAILFALFFEEK